MEDLKQIVAMQEAERFLAARMEETFMELQESTGWAPLGSFNRDYDEHPEGFPLLSRMNQFRGRWSRVYDRQDGRYMPYYENEYDLREIRQAARNLAGFSSTAIGAVETLDTFVVGSGFTFNVVARDETQAEALKDLTEELQRVVDTFLEQNKFKTHLESQSHIESREEGESILAVVPQTGYVARIIHNQGDELTEPDSPHQINRYLGIDDHKNSSWEFGIHTRFNPELGMHDTATPLHYHFTYNDSGSQWAVVEAKNVVHIKRNVPLRAKRGVSDYLAMLPDIEGEGELTRSLAHGMKILASIPFFKEFSEVNANKRPPTGADGRLTSMAKTGGGSRSVERVRYKPGTIPQISGGTYRPGPMSSSNAVPVMDTLKWLVNRMGSFWTIPSFMLTGDTETALYSAVLAMGTPFVRRRQKEQEQIGEAHKRLIWIALRIAYETGQISRLAASWQQIERAIDITYTPPKIALESDKEQAETQAVKVNTGVISEKTAAEEMGEDPEQEESQAEEEETPLGEAFDVARFYPQRAAQMIRESWKDYP